MTLTANMIMEHPAAAAFGAAGIACQLTWPLFSGRKTMLGVQMGIGTNYSAQYALLDAWSGSFVCALGATQTLVAYLLSDRPGLRWIGLGFLPVVFSVCMMTWAGPASLFLFAASAMIMVGRMQTDVIRFRLFMLGAVPFAMTYDVSVGALPALTGATLSLLVSLCALRRELRRRAAASHATAEAA